MGKILDFLSKPAWNGELKITIASPEEIKELVRIKNEEKGYFEKLPYQR